jgi:hypothetical protein
MYDVQVSSWTLEVEFSVHPLQHSTHSMEEQLPSLLQREKRTCAYAASQPTPERARRIETNRNDSSKKSIVKIASALLLS